VSGGRQVVELLDVRQMEFVAKVPETERANVAAGQRAALKLDGLSGATLEAKVTSVGVSRGGMGFWRGPEGPVRLVDVSLTLDRPLATARPGLTAKVRIMSDPLKNVIYVPRQAIFDRDGKPLVYVKVGQGFEPRPVTITTRTENAVVISGVTEGAEIALADPERKPGQTVPAPAAAPAPGPSRT
jgi:HlyD family secretion protein